MITLSLCMIVKNEETVLGRCLRSVQGVVDETIVVDTGSSDRTKQIATDCGAQLFDFPWVDDFSAARNYSFAQATQQYILWLDADDVILPADAARLLQLKQELDPSVAAVMMKYNTGFDSAGNVTFSCYRERLSQRACHHQWQEPVHEYLQVGGKVITVDIAVTHRRLAARPSGRNLGIYERYLRSGRSLSPRGTYYFARELKDNRRVAEAAHYFQQFLQGGEGWVEDNIAACRELAACRSQQGDPVGSLQALFQSFSYDLPRAETCCQIGSHYQTSGDFARAVFWFKLALQLTPPADSWGFFLPDCWGYIPCIELAVCYDQLGDLAQANAYNEQAANYKPADPAVIHNRKYFQQRLHA